MIAIVNMGPFDDPDPLGERTYEVRINSMVLASFRHRRGDGLARCLELAGKAVEGLPKEEAGLLLRVFADAEDEARRKK